MQKEAEDVRIPVLVRAGRQYLIQPDATWLVWEVAIPCSEVRTG
jgi:hypothetical protein